jgi:hypothetical protein
MSKSTLRRLAVQIPEKEQPQFLAATFSIYVLREALRLAEETAQAANNYTTEKEKLQYV